MKSSYSFIISFLLLLFFVSCETTQKTKYNKKRSNSVTDEKIRTVIPLGHSSDITSLTYSPDGKYIVSTAKDDTVKLWTAKGKLIRTFLTEDIKKVYKNKKKRFARFRSRTMRSTRKSGKIVFFSPDSKFIICSELNRVLIWKTTGKLVKTINAYYIKDFKKNKRYFATIKSGIYKPEKIQVWSTSGTLKCVLMSASTKYTRGSFDYTSDGKHFLVTTSSGIIKLFSNKGTLLKAIDYRKKNRFLENRYIFIECPLQIILK